MTLMQEDLQSIPEEFEATSYEPGDEPDDLEGYEAHEAKRGKFAGLIRGSRGYIIGLTFVAGLLLGWMVIGWWLWPVQWTNSSPWDLHPEHQKTFVGLVAEEFWRTSDVSRAREALAGWDDQALADLLAQMQAQASSPEARQHLEALAEALALPETEANLLTSLLDQKVIILGALLSVLPLVLAIALAVSPLVRNRRQPGEELLSLEEQLEGTLEELLAQEGGEGGGGGGEEEEEEGQEGQQQEGEEQEEQQAEGEGEEEEEEEEYEEEDEEELESDAGMEELVFSLFDEEDTALPALESLCKNLLDIDAPDLLEQAKKVAHDLSRGNALRHK
jgi:hypothetical protein